MGWTARGLGSLLLVVAAVSGAGAEMSYGNGPFRVEWSVLRSGAIEGTIFNDYQDPAASIKLLIEPLDAAGRVLSANYVWVGGEIGALDRRTFRLTKLPPAERYRVKVWSYEIRVNSGCCGVQ